MHMSVWRVLFMEGCHPQERCLQSFIQSLHGFVGKLLHVYISVCIFFDRIGAYDKAIEKTAIYSPINEAVCLKSSHGAISAKQGTDYFFPVLAWPLLNISH